MEAKINLGLHHLLDVFVFDRAEILLHSIFLVNCHSSFKQLKGPKEGAEVFGPERRPLMQFGCYCCAA